MSWPPKFTCWSPNPQCDCIWRQDLREDDKGHGCQQGELYSPGLVPLEAGRTWAHWLPGTLPLLAVPFQHVRTEEEGSVWEQEAQSTSTFAQDFLASRTEKMDVYCLSHPGWSSPLSHRVNGPAHVQPWACAAGPSAHRDLLTCWSSHSASAPHRRQPPVEASSRSFEWCPGSFLLLEWLTHPGSYLVLFQTLKHRKKEAVEYMTGLTSANLKWNICFSFLFLFFFPIFNIN